MTRFNWLLLAHFESTTEKNKCFEHLSHVTVGKEVTVYVAMFGPYISSPVLLRQITVDGHRDLGTWPTSTKGQGYRKFLPTVKHLVDTFVRLNIPIHGVDFYGHSGGLILGMTSQPEKIFMTIIDFTDHVLAPLKPRVVIFDSCYMGMVSALYEMSRVKSIKYVVASPSYHPSHTVLETRAFGMIHSRDKNALSRQLRRMTCEFQNMTFPRYRCFLLFDLTKVPRFVQKLKRHGKNLKFDETTRIHRSDPVLHDLWRAASDDKSLRALIKEVSKDTCGLGKCHVIRGMSIEIKLPKEHLQVYKKTAWYKAHKEMYKGD